MRAFTLLSVAVLLLAACSPRLSKLEAETLAREVASLLAHHTRGALPRELWPASVVALRPKAVSLRDDGMYITTWSLFVQEGGVFIPHAATTPLATHGSDPQFESLGDGVFSYKISG